MIADLIADTLSILTEATGYSLTYRRGALSVALRGVPGRSLFSAAEAEQFQTRFSSHDWLVPPDELVLDDVETLPQAGDLIEQTDGAKLHTFEVLPDPAGECYRLDSTGRVLRIHTKRIQTEAAP